MNEAQPLVSICIPTYNRSHHIWRTLESCIHQTYTNIEIVVVDDGSSDDTKEVVMRYANNDSRIKYFRNEENIGSGNSFLKSLEYATGYFAQCLGSDDWISRAYIEEGVRNFQKYPEAAAVFTNIVSLEFTDASSPFRFMDEDFLEPGRYSTDWFFSCAFDHPHLGGKGFISFLRREDLRQALQKAIENPVNLLDRGRRREVIDSAAFWGVPIKYKYFVIIRDAAYIKSVHGRDHVGLQGDFEEQGGFISYTEGIRHAYEAFYKKAVPHYYEKMRLSFGTNIAIDVFLTFFKQRLRIREWKQHILPVARTFFRDYTFLERCLITVRVPLVFLFRFFRRIRRSFMSTHIFVPDKNHFLSKDFRFEV